MNAFISFAGFAAKTSGSTRIRHSFCSSSVSLRTRRLLHVAKQPLNRTHMSMVKSNALRECISWLDSNSGNASNVLNFSSVDTRSKRGISISTGNKVLERTELASLPEGTYIGIKEAKKLLDESSPAFSSSVEVTDSTDFVALALLLERSKSSSSSFGPFLNTLPGLEELECVPLWSAEELEMLRGSSVYEDVKDWLKNTEEEWTALDKRFFQQNRDVFPDKYFSLRDYRWALCICSSRGFYVSQSEPLVLAPILSLLTPPEPECTPAVKAELTGGMFFAKKKLTLTANQDMKQGDMVTISYGRSVRNAVLAFTRGLTIDDSRCSSVVLPFEISSLDRFYEDKQDILETYEVEINPKFEIVGGRQSGEYEAPDDMDSFLRLLCLTGTDAFLLEAVFRGEVWNFMGLPVSAENEKAACELVVNAAADMLEEYSYDFEQKEENGVTERKRMAKCIVEGEKDILRNLQQSYRRRLNSLDGLEYYAERRLKMLDLLRPIDECEIVDSESGGRVARAFDENY